MITYKIKFMIESAPVEPEDNSDEMECTSRLPFVPRIGDMIAVTAKDDLREVERVYWTPRDGLCVWFVFDTNATPKVLKAAGWRATA